MSTSRRRRRVAEQPGYAHCDRQFDRPTVTVGDTVLARDARLLVLDEPESREVAARFGPPDIMLDDNPQMTLPRPFSGGALDFKE